MRELRVLGAVLLVAALAGAAVAHPGRRFEIVVDDGQLAARGYNSGLRNGGLFDDGAGIVRPYLNALHGHWNNRGTAAFSELPSFDLLDDASSFVAQNSPHAGGFADELLGADLTLTLVAGYKWTTPSAQGPVTLTPLGDGDEPVIVRYGGEQVDTTPSGLGSLLLAADIGPDGAEDLDLEYQIAANPLGEIYALEWVLSANNGLETSDSIYTFLSPDPSVAGLHHASLNAERSLGVTAVPEPGAAFALGLLAAAGLTLRRRGLSA